MNIIYKVVWSKVKHCYVVTSELAKRNGKGCGARSLRMAAATLGVAAALLGGFATPVAEAVYVQVGDKHYAYSGGDYGDYYAVDNLYWNPSGKSLTVTADTTDDIGNVMTVDSTSVTGSDDISTKKGSRNVFGNVAYGSANGTHVIVVRSRSGKGGKLVVDGQEKQIYLDPGAAGYYGAHGTISGYSVTIDMGSSSCVQSVFGGISSDGDVTQNKVELKSGTVQNVYGGNSTTGNANRNVVKISDGTVGGYVTGGASYAESEGRAANNNTVEISGGTVSAVIGGNSYYSGTDQANGNQVSISGSAVITDYVSGAEGSNETNNNIVTINGATVKSNSGNAVVAGASNNGFGDEATANQNQVIIKGSAQVEGVIYGAHDAYYTAANSENSVTIQDGAVVTGNVFGGAGNGDGNSEGKDRGIRTKNKVIISGSAQVTGNVYGGRQHGKYDYSYTGNATDNTVTISGGTLTGNAYGGSVSGYITGNATGNQVSVEGGSVTGNVYGGTHEVGEVNGGALTREVAGNVTGNSVSVSKVTVSGNVYGGYVAGEKVTGDANSNTVEITGGTVTYASVGTGDSVYGGYSEGGNADNNNVEISGNSKVNIEVYGGVTKYTDGTANGNTVTVKDSAELPSGITAGWSPGPAKEAKNNTVTIDGGTVKGYINGGVATGAADNNHIIVNDGTVSYLQGGSGGSSATGNTVEINGGTVTDTNTIFGGNSNAGTVTENTVTINKGTVNTIYGGYSNSGTVTNNTVTISDGSINGRVYGGSNGTGDTNGNKVLITGGALSSTVYGGYGYNGVVTGNTVTMTAGQVNSFVYGGVSETKAASSNNVKVSGGKVSGGVIGGRSGKDYGDGHPAVEDVKNNTVEISGDAEVTSAVYGGRITNATANVEDNTVTIKDSSKVNRGIHGGQTNYGNAIHNKVTIEGGTITGQSYGDYVTGGRVSSDSNGKAQNNEVEISGGTVSITVQGGFAQGGETTGNKVTISGGTVTATVEGAYNTGDVRNNSVTITGGKLSNLVSGGRGSGSATGNTVAISGGTDSWIIIGGNGMRGATGNTVTISGGDLTVTQDRARPIYGGYTDFYDDSPRDATGNTVNLTGNTTGLETRNIVGGYIYNEGSGDVVIGNELHVGGTKDGSITGTWTGSSNNKVNKVANFETIAYHSVKWDTSVAALDATAVENVGAIDINDLAFTGAASSGTMAMLKSGSDLSAIKLNYSGGTGIAITTDGVVISGGGTPTTETDGVNGVKLTSTSSDKVLLAADKLAINYTKGVGTVSAITFGEFDIDADNATRNLSGSTFATTNTVYAKDLKFKDTTKALQKNASITLLNNATGITTTVANGTGKTIGIKGYEDPQKIKYNATATGNVTSEGGAVKYTVGSVTVNSIDLAGWTGTTSDLSLGDTSGWTGAGVAVSGSFTEPEMKANSSTDIVKGAASGFFTEAGIADAIKYKEGAGFTGDEANGVTLAGKQSKGVQAADSGKKLVYAVGAKEVTEVSLGNMAVGTPRTMEDGYDFSGVTTITASDLQFDKPENVKANTVLVANAAGLAAGKTVTGKDHAQNFTKTAENQVVLSASLKGTVETVAGAVNYKYGGTELTKVDLANWNGASSDASSVTDGWTLGTGASVTTGDLSKAGLTLLKPGETKTILTVGDTIAFTNAMISGAKKWQDGGPIDDSADTSGVKIAGSTTGGGVKVNDSNAHQLIYQQDKKEVTSLTIGSVAYDTSKAVRTFGNGDDLTAAAIDASGFSLSNLDTVKADMKAGDTMVIVDAAKAIKGTGGATLKDFAKQNAGDAIKFSDKIAETVLTFSGTHQDTLEQNDAKTQIIYKVGDKIVSDVAFDGSVTWNDSAAYYENKADANGKFAYTFNGATNVNAENLKVTGETTKALKIGDAMTLLSATGMTADTVTDQSDANKEASKVEVNYKDDKGITFVAEAKGEVKTEAAAVKYNINEVKLTDVDLSAWTGTESAVPETWMAEDGSVKVATGSFAAPEVGAGTSKNILTASGAFFADANISGANKYDEANGKAFSETQNNVTVSGKQAKGVAASEDSKSLIYKVDIKKVDTVTLGAVNWEKGASLLDGSKGYDYANVTAIGTDGFDVTYASPETVAANDSMTLLKANETLKAIVNEEKAKAYSFEPVSGVTVDAAITGKLANSGNNVMFKATENRASKLTFGDVEWKNSGALMTRPSNIIFAGADVDISKINFYKEMYLEADRTMTLVSDFGDSVGTITGSKYLVGTAFEGEGQASLSGSDLIFTTKTEAGVSEQTHKAVMAAEANMALLKTGNEYVGKVMDGLSDIANMGKDGISTMAAIGGGASRYETGSHVNTRTWNAAVAIGRRNETKKGTVEYGIFGEYGKGSYTLHSDVGRSDGDAHYAGGGLMAKFTNKHDVYTEASFRLGRMSDSADDLLRDGAGNAYGYDIHANYFGAHIGVGKVFKYDKGKSLDVYGKYFYTKRDGAEFDALQHYNLDSVKSSILRIGARYGTTNKLWNWYGGLAYEYEFDGEAEGTVNNTAIRAASVKGSSVRGELGLRMEASKTNPWQTDINIYGYGGKHRGFGGNVSVAYMF